MSCELGLVRHRLTLKPFPVNEPLTRARVDRQVRNAQRRQVVEEVAALRGIDGEILEGGFGDDPGGWKSPSARAR